MTVLLENLCYDQKKLFWSVLCLQTGIIACGPIGSLLGSSKEMIFLGRFPKKRGGGNLFLNKILDYGGPKREIFIPKCTKGGPLV